MKTINEIMKKMWEADTDQDLQLMITLNPSVVRIEQCMRECALEAIEEVTHSPYIGTDAGGVYIDEYAIEVLKQSIENQ